MNRTVLICGAAGYIGRQAVVSFQRNGWHVFGAGRPMRSAENDDQEYRYFQGDFRSQAFVAEVLQVTNPERIVFLAGPASVQASFANPVEDFSSQTLPLLQLLDGARRLDRPPGVLHVSSAAVYGNPSGMPVTEESPCRPISPYGFHKLQQEALLSEFSTLFGLPTCGARVFSTYGIGLRHLAVWDIAGRALQGNFSLHGSGVESRDYLHVSDVAAALERICQAAPFKGEKLNVASGSEVTIEHLASLIYGAIGAAERPRFEGAVELGKPTRWCADVTRLNALGYRPKVRLEDGIKETVEWIRANA